MKITNILTTLAVALSVGAVALSGYALHRAEDARSTSGGVSTQEVMRSEAGPAPLLSVGPRADTNGTISVLNTTLSMQSFDISGEVITYTQFSSVTDTYLFGELGFCTGDVIVELPLSVDLSSVIPRPRITYDQFSNDGISRNKSPLSVSFLSGSPFTMQLSVTCFTGVAHMIVRVDGLVRKASP